MRKRKLACTFLYDLLKAKNQDFFFPRAVVAELVDAQR